MCDLQESRELLQCQQSLEKSPAAMNAMLEKLQQRVSDRDAALEVSTYCGQCFSCP